MDILSSLLFNLTILWMCLLRRRCALIRFAFREEGTAATTTGKHAPLLSGGGAVFRTSRAALT
uniref:Uncharacterized protein n=1 Tax=Bellilinea caldifistulae TaxID=360411 RepID=A0A7C4Q520_9CHLR